MTEGPVLGRGRPLELAAFDEPAWRVHPVPERLPEPRREEPAPSRFDDPDGIYVVRYLADSLRGCLLECMARLRPETADDHRWRQQVSGVDEACEPSEAALHVQAIAEWLAAQRVTSFTPADAPGRYVDLTHPKNHDILGKDPRVAKQIAQLARDGWINQAVLDGAGLRVAGSKGRALTQAISRAVYDAQPRPDGIRYRSRIDDSEACWAVFGHVDVVIGSNEPLDEDNAEHRAAVRDVAHLWSISLPNVWQ